MVWHEFHQYATGRLEIWVSGGDSVSGGDLRLRIEIFLEKRVFEEKRQLALPLIYGCKLPVIFYSI